MSDLPTMRPSDFVLENDGQTENNPVAGFLEKSLHHFQKDNGQTFHLFRSSPTEAIVPACEREKTSGSLV